MSDIYFTTNPSDFSKVEGLYVSERKPAGFIRGRDLSTIGLAGRCVRGPTTPLLVTSVGTFVDIYGERDYGSGGALIGQVWAALLNKPFGPIVVRRVAASDAVKASFTLESAAGGAGTQLLRVDASSVGIWGNLVGVSVTDASDGVSTHFNLLVKYQGKTVTLANLDISTGNDNTALVVGSDPARLVDLVKLASGRPVNNAASTDGADASGFVLLGQVVASYTSVAGSEGTLAVTDYNAGMNDLAVFPDVAVALVPEIVAGSVATFHSNLVTLAAAVSDRVFFTWSQAHGQSVSTEVTQVGTQITTRSDRIVWAYNSAWTIDPKVGQEIQTGPHVWLASIASQVDVNVHLGSSQTMAYLAGITRLTNTTLTRGDFVALKAAGISTLERKSSGFQFRSVVTTSLEPGKTELARRRATDFLQLSAADRLSFYVKGENTAETRNAMAGELTAFSEALMAKNRVVEKYAIDSVSVNTDAQRAQGEEHLLWRVKLIGHMLAVVLETDISTGTVIEQ
jgi:hypothetical protein